MGQSLFLKGVRYEKALSTAILCSRMCPGRGPFRDCSCLGTTFRHFPAGSFHGRPAEPTFSCGPAAVVLLAEKSHDILPAADTGDVGRVPLSSAYGFAPQLPGNMDRPDHSLLDRPHFGTPSGQQADSEVSQISSHNRKTAGPLLLSLLFPTCNQLLARRSCHHVFRRHAHTVFP